MVLWQINDAVISESLYIFFDKASVIKKKEILFL